MKSQMGNSSKAKSSFIVSEEIEKMKEALSKKFEGRVKLTRSRAETKLIIILKGNLEKTEEKLQKIYKSLTSL